MNGTSVLFLKNKSGRQKIILFYAKMFFEKRENELTLEEGPNEGIYGRCVLSMLTRNSIKNIFAKCVNYLAH